MVWVAFPASVLGDVAQAILEMEMAMKGWPSQGWRRWCFFVFLATNHLPTQGPGFYHMLAPDHVLEPSALETIVWPRPVGVAASGCRAGRCWGLCLLLLKFHSKTHGWCMGVAGPPPIPAHGKYSAVSIKCKPGENGCTAWGGGGTKGNPTVS